MNPPRDDGGRREDGGWDEYRRLVVDTLDRLDHNIGDLKKSVDVANINIAMLKVKAGFWGALGGLMAGLAAYLMAKFGK